MLNIPLLSAAGCSLVQGVSLFTMLSVKATLNITNDAKRLKITAVVYIIKIVCTLDTVIGDMLIYIRSKISPAKSMSSDFYSSNTRKQSSFGSHKKATIYLLN